MKYFQTVISIFYASRSFIKIETVGDRGILESGGGFLPALRWFWGSPNSSQTYLIVI